jgi:hypothetical protein
MSGHAAPQAAVLDAATAALIQPGMAMKVASRDAQHRTSLAWCYGFRFSEDLSRVTLFVSLRQAAELLEHVRATGQLAAVFSELHSNRSVQLKGADVRIIPLEPGDVERVRGFREAFLRCATEEGYNVPVMRAYVQVEAVDLISLCFSPTAAFLATPGPDDGQPLRRRA